MRPDRPAEVAPSGDSMAATLRIEPLGSYRTGIAFKGAAEVVSFAAVTRQAWVANTAETAIDVLDLTDPAHPTRAMQISLTEHGTELNSVSVRGTRAVAALGCPGCEVTGRLVILDLDGRITGSVVVGASPDSVEISPDGRFAVSANEGELKGTDDPEGSVSIVDLDTQIVTTIDFRALDVAPPPGLHRAGPPGTPMSRDLEPEYVAISPDSTTAWVTLQEASGLAIVDLRTATLVDVVALGARPPLTAAFDASDRDGGIHLQRWPVHSMYQPDQIAAFAHDGATWLVTANEGDSRDGKQWSEETRVAELSLDPIAFPDAADLQRPERLGRLKTTTMRGDIDGDGDHDQIFAFGSRSLAIWSARGELVWDSGDAIARLFAAQHPTRFNSQGQPSSFDSRSDDKGCEPEGVTLGEIAGRRYAFVTLERAGGVTAWDLTDPRSPVYAGYGHSIQPDGDLKADTAGDIAPEGVAFVSAEHSPTGDALLLVAHEVTGSTAVFRVTPQP